ncbi:MAG TPA: CBS domain-containing protein [Anaerolineae bacterium]|nr:CBS domain-containing protein [Anaerolineae bacterium]
MKHISVLAAKHLGVIACPANATLLDAARMMDEEDISSIIVVDDTGHLRGILTRTDILRAALERPDDWEQLACPDWMTKDVVTVPPTASLEDAARLLQQKHIHRVVVAEDDGQGLVPLAVVSARDIIYHLVHQR